MTTLHLAIQYASEHEAPRRDRVRRWVMATLSTLASRIERVTLTVRFVDEAEGRELNRGFRGKDYATNVLTFPLVERDGAIEADIVVCLPVVEAEARTQRKPVMQHCTHLVIHGTLHACGYVHEEEADAAAMEAIERAVLTRFRIADPYA